MTESVNPPKHQDWLPPRTRNPQGQERRVGVELEFAGVEPQDIVQTITATLGGRVEHNSRFHFNVVDTCLGEFVVELDAHILQLLVDQQPPASLESLTDRAEELLQKTAEPFVPWEVVSPPISCSQLQQLQPLVTQLRQLGAQGTRRAVQYAFGLHLNPELPDLSATTITHFLQAYLLLYDWLCEQEQVDLSRKLTPYIDHFEQDYILLVCDNQYQPDLPALIQDYLAYNPSRNRSLDLLPLLAYLDSDCITDLKDRALVKPRPTFHYRLPNCDIDNPDWNLYLPWSRWLEVEKLAGNPTLRSRLIDDFRQDQQRLTHRLDHQWLQHCQQVLKANH